MTEKAAEFPELDYVLALDLETSGLNEQGDQVLEIACIFGAIKNGVFFEYEDAKHQHVLPVTSDIYSWHPKVLEMHCANGLLAEAVALTNKLQKEDVKAAKAWSTKCPPCPHHLFSPSSTPPGLPPPSGLSTYLPNIDATLAARAAKGLPEKAKWTLFGNSVHFDLRFVRRVFPQLAKHLSHRVFDCSAARLFCEALGRPHEKGDVAHRAMADIEQSIALYNTLRDWVQFAPRAG